MNPKAAFLWVALLATFVRACNLRSLERYRSIILALLTPEEVQTAFKTLAHK